MRTLKSIISVILTVLFALSLTFVASAYQDDKSDYYTVGDDGSYSFYNITDFDRINKTSAADVHICDLETSDDIIITNEIIESITFENCKISSKIISLPESVTAVTIDSSEFSDYDFLGTISRLDSLTIQNMSGIKDLSPFKSAASITTVFVKRSAGFVSLHGIEVFENLDYVAIVDCGIEDIKPLASLKLLDTLILTSTNISSIEPVKNAPLKRLYLSNSINIRNLDLVTNFEYLLELYTENLEMAYTKKLLDFVQKNNIETNIRPEDLAIKKEVQDIAKSILNDDMTPQQKIEAIVMYVMDTIEYDPAVDWKDGNELSIEYNRHHLKYALAKKGVCCNYTGLVTALVYEAGFVSYEVENGIHVWNLVKINNHFFWLDATWLDEIYECSHDDFVLNDNYCYMTTGGGFDDTHSSGFPIPASYKHENLDFSKIDFDAEIQKSDWINATTSHTDDSSKHESTNNKNMLIIIVPCVILTVFILAFVIVKLTKTKRTENQQLL